MARRLKMRMRDALASAMGRGRVGPFDPADMDFMLDLLDVRDGIERLGDPAARRFLAYAMSMVGRSRSQVFQDAFVLWVTNEKRGGFFCEFGATNGVDLSNSHLLETGFGWRGICAEPARNWHEALRRNRPGAIIETECVWSASGERLAFSESPRGELSTLETFRGADEHAHRRRSAVSYEVTTISLNDLLERHGAPEAFDYLSVDTEGSELAILEAFDLERWRPTVVSVEHNYTANRDGILAVMERAGYRRVLTGVSLFDDWYLAPGTELPDGG